MNPRAGQRRVNLSKPRIDESPWEGVPADWQDKLGFIYLITHKETGKFYVGKKLFWKAAPKKGNRKTFEESDWRKYWSSSKELQADIKKEGKSAFSRRIIATADTKSVLSMIELHYQLNWCVPSDNTYNGIINIRAYLHQKVKQGYREFIVNDNSQKPKVDGGWLPPESAPMNGTLILGDFGWPWPLPAVWDTYDEQWCVVTMQASPMQDGAYNYWLETDTENKSQLKRWMPMPSLPNTSVTYPAKQG